MYIGERCIPMENATRVDCRIDISENDIGDDLPQCSSINDRKRETGAHSCANGHIYVLA
jgi:hypothetical protein